MIQRQRSLFYFSKPKGKVVDPVFDSEKERYEATLHVLKKVFFALLFSAIIYTTLALFDLSMISVSDYMRNTRLLSKSIFLIVATYFIFSLSPDIIWYLKNKNTIKEGKLLQSTPNGYMKFWRWISIILIGLLLISSYMMIVEMSLSRDTFVIPIIIGISVFPALTITLSVCITYIYGIKEPFVSIAYTLMIFAATMLFSIGVNMSAYGIGGIIAPPSHIESDIGAYNLLPQANHIHYDDEMMVIRRQERSILVPVSFEFYDDSPELFDENKATSIHYMEVINEGVAKFIFEEMLKEEKEKKYLIDLQHLNI